MAVTSKLKKSEAKPQAAAASKIAEAPVIMDEKKAASRRKSRSLTENPSENALRAKILNESFIPETIAYLKDNFGLDVKSPAFPVQALYDIAHHNITQPLEAVITPKGYDRDEKIEVELPKIRTISSFRFVLPFDKDFKPVVPDKGHALFVQAFPCHEYLVKADKSEAVASQPQENDEVRQNFQFTNAQLLALEGVGIAGDRLFGGFNALSIDQLVAIRDGVPFEFDGTVKTDAGYINVSGTATMKEGPDGRPVVSFVPNELQEKSAEETLDLLSINKLGNLELDFFERSKTTGDILKDTQGRPIINKAARDLLEYGISMEPVKGITHTRSWDDTERVMRYIHKTNYYQVAVVNGGLVADKMNRIVEKNEKGEDIMIGTGKKAFAKYHYEVANPRISKDGTVRLSNNAVGKFVSEADELSYRCGKGGAVEGATWKVFGKGKDVQTKSYVAFIVPDPLRGGFPKQFSPETSKILIEREKPKVKKTQNFGIGF